MQRQILASALFGAVALAQSCPDYSVYSQEKHAPFSSGVYNLSYARPAPACRTFNSSAVENIITEYQHIIADPDLYRLFQNAYPNTLDTAIKWHGYANGSTDEELTFVITGDINAMWLRDSANQMQSYLPVLTADSSNNSIASLYRGVINLQSRYILYDPFCNSFQPPVESGIAPSVNGAASDDTVYPTYSNETVFECKYELDSLAAFLEVSTRYYQGTNDLAFFGKYNWIATIKQIMNTANAMMEDTYAANGSVNQSPYTFTRETTRASETLENNGLGNPVKGGTGLIRSAFRPSDDAAIFQLFIPANMMFSTYLSTCAEIVQKLGGHTPLYNQMTKLSTSVRTAIEQHGIYNDPVHGQIYAYEIDGYGGINSMDDANIPSLLSAPVYGFLDMNDPVYQATRKKILSADNPYFMRGPVLNAVGGPHDGPGYGWPMAIITRILTSNNAGEVTGQLQQLLNSTAGLGLIHESINTFDEEDWTRQWFSWANGLFGQMIIDVHTRFPKVLSQSFQ